MKTFIITYRSRYYLFDTRKKKIGAISKKWIRSNWHEIMETDEFVIVKIEEV